jgi:hypothetical protein
MSAKPTSLPRWADVGGDIVEPTSGKKNVGWVSDEEPPAQYMNWLQNLNYLWTQYLSDGVFDGDHQFLDNVDIDGNLNVDGNLTIGGSFNVTSLGLLEDPGNGTNKVILDAPAALAADYALVFPSGNPAKKGVWRVSSSGVITFETTFNIIVSVKAGGNGVGTSWTYDPHGQLASVAVVSGDTYFVPIEGLQFGWRILGFRFIASGVNSSNNVQVELQEADSSVLGGFATLTGGSATATGAGGSAVTQTATLSTPNTVTQDRNLLFKVTADGAGNSTRALYYLELSMDYGA